MKISTSSNSFLLPVVLLVCVAIASYVWIDGLVEVQQPGEILSPSTSTEALSIPPGQLPAAESQVQAVQASATVQASTKGDVSRLEGRIVDANGNGLAGIELRLRTLRGTDRGFILRQDLTDAEGRFAMNNLDPQGVYLLFTEALVGFPIYRRNGFTLDSLPQPFEIRLERLDLVNIEATVVDVEHAPVANFTLTVDSVDTEYPSRAVTSDDSGYFRIEAFPAGELKAFTTKPEYYRISGLRVTADEYRNLTLAIDRGRYRLSGQVLDEKGEPLRTARITLSSVISSVDYDSHSTRTAMADELGQFDFSGVGGIAHTLRVYANGYKPYTGFHEFQSFSDEVEIRMGN